MTRSCNSIYDVHVKVQPSVCVCTACGFLTCFWLLLAVCIDCSEAEMADLSATGMPVSQVDCLMFTDSTLTLNNYYGHPPGTSFSMGESPVAAAQSMNSLT